MADPETWLAADLLRTRGKDHAAVSGHLQADDEEIRINQLSPVRAIVEAGETGNLRVVALSAQLYPLGLDHRSVGARRVNHDAALKRECLAARCWLHADRDIPATRPGLATVTGDIDVRVGLLRVAFLLCWSYTEIGDIAIAWRH